jgi:hypothetical protein
METHKVITEQAEYSEGFRMLAEYNKAMQDWCIENKTNGIPLKVTATFPHADKVDNTLRSALEEYAWRTDPPESYFLYINEIARTANTWTGQKLGEVTFGKQFKSNMGDIRVPIEVLGSNDCRYHGIFYKSSGDYARIKMFKNHQIKKSCITK